VQKTCDRIIIIREGEIIETANIEELRSRQPRVFTITTKKGTKKERIAKADIDKFIKGLSKEKDEILDIEVSVASLEDIFMTMYDKNSEKKGVQK
jgi:ABC-type multidrug transport system ATPase subunit